MNEYLFSETEKEKIRRILTGLSLQSISLEKALSDFNSPVGQLYFDSPEDAGFMHKIFHKLKWSE